MPDPATPLEDDVVVTGSRIARNGATTTTPTVMLRSEDVANAGAVSPGRPSAPASRCRSGLERRSSGVGLNSAGFDPVDLRALGTNRTLVLVNGRRQVGSNTSTTSVDLNTMPTPLIERVEVITGGAFVMYGADAVSGVLNVILERAERTGVKPEPRSILLRGFQAFGNQAVEQGVVRAETSRSRHMRDHRNHASKRPQPMKGLRSDVRFT